jgi:hypothetical protein
MTRNSSADSLLMRDFREEMAHKQRENDERRKHELVEQTSPLKTAGDRIRIWEQRHHLSLPRNPEHHLIDVIADATALTRGEVLHEQRERAENRPIAAARPLER